MPNPKLGTVTLNIRDAVLAAKRGQAEFRVEKRGIVMAALGKVSFTSPELRENIRAFLLAVSDQKPEGIKGVFMRTATLASTMGPGIPLDMAYLDPASPRFLEPFSAMTATGEGQAAPAAATKPLA